MVQAMVNYCDVRSEVYGLYGAPWIFFHFLLIKVWFLIFLKRKQKKEKKRQICCIPKHQDVLGQIFIDTSQFILLIQVVI